MNGQTFTRHRAGASPVGAVAKHHTTAGRYVACVVDPAQYDIIVRAVGGHQRVQFCSTASEVVTIVHTEPLVGIVWEAWPELMAEILEAVRTIRSAHPLLPQLFIFVTLDSATQAVLAISKITTRLVVMSLQGNDDLEQDIQRLVQIAAMRSTDAIIMGHISPVIPSHLGNPILAAVMVGRRGGAVKDMARVCGCSTETLRARLAENGTLSPGVLLRWTLMLHSLRAIEIGGHSIKAVASELGFVHPEALANCSARLFGVRPRELLRNGGFGMCLDEFRLRLANRD